MNTKVSLFNLFKRKQPDYSPNTINNRKDAERERGVKRRLDKKTAQQAIDRNDPDKQLFIIIDNKEINIEDLSVIQLKLELRNKKINHAGNKKELIEKLKQV